MIGAPDVFSSDVLNFDNTVALSSNIFFAESNFSKMFKKDIGPYIAGLWEADGHILLPSLDQKGKLKNTPCLCITSHYQQLPLLKTFKGNFGGWIRYKTKQNAIVWTITAKIDLLKIVNLINGYIRSPKLYQFNLLIDYLNKNSLGAKLVQHSTDCSPLFENYWLAGFIDANGSFIIRYTKSSANPQTGHKTKERMALSFRIEQRKNHEITNDHFEPIIKSIADFLNVKLHNSRHNETDYWLVELSSLSRMQILLKYLKDYPLLTTKRNDYDDFYKAFKMFLANQHHTLEEKKMILNLKNQMNRKRNVFNWDHLN